MLDLDALMWRLGAMKLPREFDYLEFYAGAANLSKCMASAHYNTRSFDVLYHEQPPTRKSNFMNLCHASGFGLALLCILRCRANDFAIHLGLKCSSLCKMNRGTSRRSACASVGYTDYPSVAVANTLIERSSLMVALTACLGGLWTVEQPGGSLLEFYPSWREIMSRLFEHGGANCVTPLF
ncbi:unnamed protein product [Cladocopium goreaui]|uniref:Uncharacterized protein n=1 Tax=Cladocopium goreaui TaxID=2562237 RepID=A0A9P1GQE4_9DINO|nr:unnamed protein product [Cladocopium goreaui]